MDPVCHTLVGVALGRAGLARRTRYGMAALVIGANLPDLDVLALAWGDVAALSFRRGWTHGALALLVLPPALAALLLAIDRAAERRRRRRGRAGGDPARVLPLLFLSGVAVFTHPLLDLLNVYGVRLLMPFSDRWFYSDALFIVDPWMWLVLGGGVWLSGPRRVRPGSARAAWPARLALLLAGAYALAMAVASAALRAPVARRLAAAGHPPERLMVAPLPVTPLRRYVVFESGGRHGIGTLSLLPSFDLRLAGVSLPACPGSPLQEAAARAPHGRAFLSWARFPWYAELRRDGRPAIRIRDARYPGAAGEWAGVVVEPPPRALTPGSPPPTCSGSTRAAPRDAPD